MEISKDHIMYMQHKLYNKIYIKRHNSFLANITRCRLGCVLDFLQIPNGTFTTDKGLILTCLCYTGKFPNSKKKFKQKFYMVHKKPRIQSRHQVVHFCFKCLIVGIWNAKGKPISRIHNS